MKHTFIKYFYRSALYGVFIMHGEFPFGLYRLMIDADTLQVPFIQAVNTFVYFYFMVPSQTVQLAYVRQLAQCAVRFRCIPAQFTLEADFLHDFLCHFADRHFLARTHVDVAVMFWNIYR